MAKTKNQRLKEKRKELYNENPFCPECRIKMILPEEIGFITLPNGNKRLKQDPKNLCTIEHKYSKLNPKRQEKNHTKEIRHSLLCRKCNNENGKKDIKSFLTIEQEWERSGYYPKNHPKSKESKKIKTSWFKTKYELFKKYFNNLLDTIKIK